MSLTDGAPESSGAPAAVLAAVDYSHIPFIPRRWLWEDYVPVGNPVMLAAAGGTGKGLLTCLVIARVVLGLPFPGEDPELRRSPGRVVHIAGSEDDQFEDLAPRFRAAIAAAVAEYGLDPELAGERGAIRYIHDLSEWPDGSPFELPADMGRLAAEVAKLNALGGPDVALVVLDPFADMLGEKDTISTVKGARRVLRPVKLFARQSDVALVIVHHLTKDGKVSGSPAVVDALRLAFIIERAPDDETVRVITNVKSNIAHGMPQRYRIAGHGPATHAGFVDAADARTERVARAAERAAEAPEDLPACDPAPGSFRARMASAAPAAREVRAGVLGTYPDADPGPFKVLRLARPCGVTGSSHDVRSSLGENYATRADAWQAVMADCGAVVTYRAHPDDPRRETAGMVRPDGSRVTYLVAPLLTLA